PQYKRFSRIIKELNASSEKAVSRRLRTEMVLEWREEYTVGVKEIDSQHKFFWGILQRLSDLHLNGISSAEEINQRDMLLDELLDYAQLHFRTEEEIMARYKYPLIQDQQKEHEIITSELTKQVQAVRYANASTAKLVYFLIQWFIKHTMYSDKEIGLFIARQRKAQAFPFKLKKFVRKTADILNRPLVIPWDRTSGSCFPVS
ncbi:MAG: hypothetical protein D3904_15350, partial [Candidatus Electrothrix sp. EH2]|nr:hypothetical protein [Candidatus Electrothrix sp. EH2]